MGKVKTRKVIAKRFKVTGTGKVMRGHLGGRHRMFHKSKRRIRTFAEPKRLSIRQARVIRAMIHN